MCDIDARSSQVRPSSARTAPTSIRLLRAAILVAVALAATFSAASAYAGAASTGDLLFYPCTTCHPVSVSAAGVPSKKLPNGFEGHGIVLQGHDRLGKGDAACLVCHDDPMRNPGKLKTIDGSLVDITGDVSLVCAKCHSDKYALFEAGAHGKGFEKCTAAGCHDPHTPSYIYASPLMPFVGTGFQVRAVSERVPFVPLASPPVPAAIVTPLWLIIVATVGAALVAGLVGSLILGRSRR